MTAPPDVEAGDAILALRDFGYDRGWRVARHPRLLADLNGDDRADLIGFGEAGTYTALAKGDGKVQDARLALNGFGYNRGWRVDRHVRLTADLNGDGRADLIAFGNPGTYTALSRGNGTFYATRLAIKDFGYNQGWRADRHVRLTADLNGDGRADLVGFGEAGTYTALAKGDGTFHATRLGMKDFGYNRGWRVDRHPRLAADLNGDGRADLVGFGNAGTLVAFSRGDGTFSAEVPPAPSPTPQPTDGRSAN